MAKQDDEKEADDLEFEEDLEDDFEDQEERASAVLQFEEVFPTDKPVFTLKDGTEIEFLMIQEFDGAEFAKISRYQKQIEGTLKQMERDSGDKKAHERLGRIAKDFVLMILPDIDSVTLGKMKLGGRMKIVEFWNANAGFGESDAEKKGRGGKNKNS